MTTGFYFQLSFGGESIAFQEVSGIQTELNIDEVVRGGENRFKYKLPTASTFQNLILKRGVLAVNSRLLAWCTASVDGDFSQQIKTHDISVSLVDGMGRSLVVWTFYNAYPVKYTMSDLRSEENNIFLEDIELAYTYFNTHGAP